MLRTERLVIRPFELTDSAFIVHHFNEASFIRNIADKGIRDLKDAENYLLTGPMAMYREMGFGLGAICLIDSHVTNGLNLSNPIGTCGLIQRDNLPGPDIGYSLAEQYWGNGYASEAVSAVINDAFECLKLQQILAVVNPDNTRSIGLLERQQFFHCGKVCLQVDAPAIDLMKRETEIKHAVIRNQCF